MDVPGGLRAGHEPVPTEASSRIAGEVAVSDEAERAGALGDFSQIRGKTHIHPSEPRRDPDKRQQIRAADGRGVAYALPKHCS
jgi:hypothetical protein